MRESLERGVFGLVALPSDPGKVGSVISTTRMKTDRERKVFANGSLASLANLGGRWLELCWQLEPANLSSKERGRERSVGRSQNWRAASACDISDFQTHELPESKMEHGMMGKHFERLEGETGRTGFRLCTTYSLGANFSVLPGDPVFSECDMSLIAMGLQVLANGT